MKLDKIQERVMRLILSESWDCPLVSMKSRLGWMTPRNRREMMRMILLRRYLSGRCPTYLRNLLRTNEELGHNCSARRNKNLYLLTPKSSWLISPLLTGQVKNGTSCHKTSEIQVTTLSK